MAVAGEHLSIYDPSCQAYPPSMTGGAGRSVLAFGEDCLDKSFPDQFAPWDFSGPLDFTKKLEATLIRIPLRMVAPSGKTTISKVSCPFAIGWGGKGLTA